MAEEGALTIERTACSPVIAEITRLFLHLAGCPDARLMIGGGRRSRITFGVCDHAVQCTIAIHGDSLAPGDVFIANDPAQRRWPALSRRRRATPRCLWRAGSFGWAVNSGHMMDMGRHGLRFLGARGDRVFTRRRCGCRRCVYFPSGAWSSAMCGPSCATISACLTWVEMDIRSLVAGSQVAHDKRWCRWRRRWGGAALQSMPSAPCANVLRREMRRRISLLEDGEYSMTTWTEWGDELYKVSVSIDHRRRPDAVRFRRLPAGRRPIISSIPRRNIIPCHRRQRTSTDVLAHDLPLSAGLFAPISLNCPDGTVVNSRPPRSDGLRAFRCCAERQHGGPSNAWMMAVAASGDDCAGTAFAVGAGGAPRVWDCTPGPIKRGRERQTAG